MAKKKTSDFTPASFNQDVHIVGTVTQGYVLTTVDKLSLELTKYKNALQGNILISIGISGALSVGLALLTNDMQNKLGIPANIWKYGLVLLLGGFITVALVGIIKWLTEEDHYKIEDITERIIIKEIMNGVE